MRRSPWSTQRLRYHASAALASEVAQAAPDSPDPMSNTFASKQHESLALANLIPQATLQTLEPSNLKLYDLEPQNLNHKP